MPELVYRGDYGSAARLTQERTTTVTLDGQLPTSPIVVLSARVRYYLDTTALPYTYELLGTINGGAYSGTLEHRFSKVDSPDYVDLPLSVEQLDPNFPFSTLQSVSISETGGHGSSVRVRGLVRVIVEYAYVPSPTPPSNLLINGSSAINLEATYPAQLTWTAGAPGTYDELVEQPYRIKRYDPTTGLYTVLGTTAELSFMIEAPNYDGRSFYFYVEIITAYHVARSSRYASIYTYIPLTPPTTESDGQALYNPRPMLMLTMGNGPQGLPQTIVADGWTPSRKGYPFGHVYLKRNSPYTEDTTETVTVTVTDELVRTATTELSIVYTKPTYTQPAIVAGETVVHAADITELQEQLNAIREAYGMEEYTFTPCVAGETSLTLWRTHLTELQACAVEIKDFINAWDTQSISYAIILPQLITTDGPSAAALNQIRQIVTML